MAILFEYAVKVVVGRADGRVVAPGEYWTAVNVHNPGFSTIEFWEKVAVALPGLQPGPVSDFRTFPLRPDQALEMDRRDIFIQAETAGFREEFLKGFVVIQCNRELDVVAVYTAAPDGTGVQTIHTERVPRRVLRTPLLKRKAAPAKRSTRSRGRR